MAPRSLILLTLIPLTIGASSSFKKCCPPGEVFSGVLINCVPAPPHVANLYSPAFAAENVSSGGLPICEKPEDISTLYLSDPRPSNFLQELSCVEILYDQSRDESDRIIVYCQSNNDRATPELYGPTSTSLPRLLDVRRCCSNNTVFNVHTGGCEPMHDTSAANNSFVDGFLSVLPKEADSWDFFNVHTGMAACTGAIFTYEISAEDVTLVNETLQVTVTSTDDASEETFGISEGNSCLELTPDFLESRQLVFRVCRSIEFCLGHRCISKCCGEGAFFNATECMKIREPESTMNFYKEISNFTTRPWNATEYGLHLPHNCPYGAYHFRRDEIDSMSPEGYIYTKHSNDSLRQNEYCIDIYSNREGDLSLSTFACFGPPMDEETVNSRFMVTSPLQAISCFFLLLTLIVYGCLPVLQNLHGKTLMCHAASLLVAYACLSIVPWVTPDTRPNDAAATKFCSALGFTMLFTLLSAFCWLNVMCFDIWRTIGRLRGNDSRYQSHNKKFLFYSLYAWGLSMSITIFAILSDTIHILPPDYRPDFGAQSCWFAEFPGHYGDLLFFRGPIAIQLTANVIFFILTAEQCSQVKAELNRVADPMDPRSKRFHADKTKFIMNVKLFIVMGISWIAEIVSSFVNQYTSYKWREEVFYATDALNCLQGLLIFLLFVMKRRVHQALKKRLGFRTKKKCSSHGTSMLQDPYKVRKSASNTTLTSSFGVSVVP